MGKSQKGKNQTYQYELAIKLLENGASIPELEQAGIDFNKFTFGQELRVHATNIVNQYSKEQGKQTIKEFDDEER